MLKSLNVDSGEGIFRALIQRKGLKNTKFARLKLTNQNDLSQDIQFLIYAVTIPVYFLMTVPDSESIWILLKVILHLMVMQVLIVKIIIKPFQSRQENLVAFDKKLKMDVVNHLNLLHCWQNMQLQANIKGVLKYVQ